MSGAVGPVDPIDRVTLTQRSKKSGRSENPQGLVAVGLSPEGGAPEGGGEGRAGKKQRTRAIQFGGPSLQLGSAAPRIATAAGEFVPSPHVSGRAVGFSKIFAEEARIQAGPPSLPPRGQAAPEYQLRAFSKLSFLPLAGEGEFSSVLSSAREPARQAAPLFVAAAVSGSSAARVGLEDPHTGPGPEFLLSNQAHLDELTEALSLLGRLEEYKKLCEEDAQEAAQEAAQEDAQKAGGLLLGHNARPFQALHFDAAAAPVPSAASVLNS